MQFWELCALTCSLTSNFERMLFIWFVLILCFISFPKKRFSQRSPPENERKTKIEIISLKPTSDVLHCAGDKIWKRHSGNSGNPSACVLSGNSCWYLLSENEGRVKNGYGWYPGRVRCSAPYSAKNVLTYDTKNTKLLHNEILLKRYPFNTPTKTGYSHYLKISMPLLKNDLFVFWID